MIADQPFVSYGKKKEIKKTKKAMDNFADAWEAKRKKEREQGIDNPFGGFANSKRVSLGEFFKDKK